MAETKTNPGATQSLPSLLLVEHYSLGIGDRFAHQAKAQLRAIQLAAEQGVEVTPVWNKSNREHSIIGSEPGSVSAAGEEATRAFGWKKTVSRRRRSHHARQLWQIHCFE